MHDECGKHQFPKPDPVGDQAGEQDDDAKPGQPAAGDCAQFRLRESVLLSPLAENARPDGEADARGEDRHEACPQQTLPVGVGHGAIESSCGGGGK